MRKAVGVPEGYALVELSIDAQTFLDMAVCGLLASEETRLTHIAGEPLLVEITGTNIATLKNLLAAIRATLTVYFVCPRVEQPVSTESPCP